VLKLTAPIRSLAFLPGGRLLRMLIPRLKIFWSFSALEFVTWTSSAAFRRAQVLFGCSRWPGAASAGSPSISLSVSYVSQELVKAKLKDARDVATSVRMDQIFVSEVFDPHRSVAHLRRRL
jgi:hypothetical protein